MTKAKRKPQYPWLKPKRKVKKETLWDKKGEFVPHRPPTFIITTGHEGSSAFIRLLAEIGVFIGKEPNLARSQHKRYYEYKKVQHINRYILGGRGYPYPFELSDRGSRINRILYTSPEHLRTMRGKLLYSMILDGLQQDQPYAIKDPRTCLTFPVWQKAFPDCNALFLDRNTQDTHKGWNAKGDDGYLWYKRYWQENYEMVDPDKRFVVNYDGLSNEFTKTVKGIMKWMRPHKRIGDAHIARAREWWKPKYNGKVREVRG